MQDTLVEPLNGSSRDELLNQTLFSSLDETREKIGAWKEDYNRDRPHSSLGTLTPQEVSMKSRPETKAARGQKTTDRSSAKPEKKRASGRRKP